jgi:hypothetical protein
MPIYGYQTPPDQNPPAGSRQPPPPAQKKDEDEGPSLGERIDEVQEQVAEGLETAEKRLSSTLDNINWRRVSNFVRSRNFKIVVSGVIGLLALIMLVGFFSFEWIATNADEQEDRVSSEVEDSEQLVDEYAMLINDDEEDAQEILQERFGQRTNEYGRTAWEMWIGSDEAAVFAIADEGEEIRGDFGEVRLIDRFLILIPLGALAILVLLGLWIAERLDGETALIGITALAVALWLFPYAWEAVKSGDFRADLQEQETALAFSDLASEQWVEVQMASITSIYSTSHQTLLGFLLMISGAIAMTLLTLDNRGKLRRSPPARRVGWRPGAGRTTSPQTTSASAQTASPTTRSEQPAGTGTAPQASQPTPQGPPAAVPPSPVTETPPGERSAGESQTEEPIAEPALQPAEKPPEVLSEEPAEEPAEGSAEEAAEKTEEEDDTDKS